MKTEIKNPEETKNNKTFKSFIKEIIPYIIILIVVVLFRTFIATPIIVSGSSMDPTFKGGEILILNKRDDFERFDIVVLNLNNSHKKEDIIKRIIALPGETIVCENGIVYVNGIRQDEEYSKGNTTDFSLVKLGEDEYFVMGDNREVSADSRVYGPFKKEDIKGTSNFVLFPFTKFGKVK